MTYLRAMREGEPFRPISPVLWLAVEQVLPAPKMPSYEVFVVVGWCDVDPVVWFEDHVEVFQKAEAVFSSMWSSKDEADTQVREWEQETRDLRRAEARG